MFSESGFVNFSAGDDVTKYYPSSNWIKWDLVATKLPELIANNSLRSKIDELPDLDVEEVTNCNQQLLLERIYTIFTFIANGYIRGNSQHQPTLKILPVKIAKIWLKSAEMLGIPPVTTYAATVLYNVSVSAGKRGEILNYPLSVEDINVKFTFTGAQDEVWFYAITAAIDSFSPEIITIAENVYEVDQPDFYFERLAIIIGKITEFLTRIYLKCNPEFFYRNIRRYLSGWYRDSEFGEEGLGFELEDGSIKYLKLVGGSAAQSPTIQLLDIILGIDHDEISNSSSIEMINKVAYLREMRSYMPREHREYLNQLEIKFSTHDRKSLRSNPSYKRCVDAMIQFRTEHIKIVTKYIVNEAYKVSGCAAGTGGSNPIPFLKRCLMDTEECNKKT